MPAQRDHFFYAALTQRLQAHKRLMIVVSAVGLVTMLAVEIPLLGQVNADGVAWLNQWLAAIGEQLAFLYVPDPTVEF